MWMATPEPVTLIVHPKRALSDRRTKTVVNMVRFLLPTFQSVEECPLEDARLKFVPVGSRPVVRRLKKRDG